MNINTIVDKIYVNIPTFEVFYEESTHHFFGYKNIILPFGYCFSAPDTFQVLVLCIQ